MTIRRATLSIVGASLLVAWFASAASVSLQRHRREPLPVLPTEPAIDTLGPHIRERAAQLKARLASPAARQAPIRNPFTFQTVAPSRPRLAAAAVVEPRPALVQAPPVEPEPPLMLIGIAGRKGAESLVRTAMLSTDGRDVVVVAVGEMVLQRYKVTAIGADAVELADVATGAPRRLVFQQF